MWGGGLMLLSLSDILNRNWIVSTLLSIALIFLINSLSFRSARYGLFSLVPLVAGIMLNFVVMAVARIPLDMTTAMFTNLACGAGVDTAIHFIIQFRRQLERTPGDLEGVLGRTMTIAGRPILLTTASVMMGLLVLSFASFLPIRWFGLLVALALLNTTAGTLILLPAILAVGSRRERKRAARPRPGPGGGGRGRGLECSRGVGLQAGNSCSRAERIESAKWSSRAGEHLAGDLLQVPPVGLGQQHAWKAGGGGRPGSSPGRRRPAAGAR